MQTFRNQIAVVSFVGVNVPGTTRSTPTSLDCLAQGIVRVRPNASAPGDLGSY